MSETPVPGIAYLSDVGRARANEVNQDSFYAPLDISPEQRDRQGWLFCVADGTSGNSGGERGSQLALNLIRESFYTDGSNDIALSLTRAIQKANEVLFARSGVLFGELSAAVACALLRGLELHTVHAGDCRVYRISANKIEQLTVDDVLNLDASGPRGNSDDASAQERVLASAVGSTPSLVPRYRRYTLSVYDRILLCTRGLTTVLSDAELQAIVTGAPPGEAVQQMVTLANERGGPENVTAMVIDPVQLRQPVATQPSNAWLPLIAGLVGASGIILVVALVVALNSARSTPRASGTDVAQLAPTATTAANRVPTAPTRVSVLAVGTIDQPPAFVSLTPTVLLNPSPPGPLPTPVQPSPTATSEVARPTTTPTELPSPTSTPSAASFVSQVNRALATLRSGQIEAMIAYSGGITSTAKLIFDLGDQGSAARLQMSSTYQSKTGTQTIERIVVGDRYWQRSANGAWTVASEQEGVWGQVQSFLPHLDSISNLSLDGNGGAVVLRWRDEARDADVTLELQPDNSTPRELRQSGRTSQSTLRVIYAGWNTLVDISPPS